MNPDDLLAPSGSTFKLSELNVGDGIQFVITSAKVMEDRDFKTKEVKLSSKGNPLWQLRLGVELNGEDRTLYLKGGQYFAFIDAVRGAGVRKFDDLVGRTAAVKRDQDTPSTTPGFAPRKNWIAKVA